MKTKLANTTPCDYCDGMGCSSATGGVCLTCHGTAKLCRLCRFPPGECECGPGRFTDGEPPTDRVVRSEF